MKPSEKLNKFLWLFRLCSSICGADIADPNYKLNFITFLVAFSITIYFILSIYTVNLKIHEGWGILLHSFCMVGSVLQGITKLVCGILFRADVLSIITFFISLYKKYEEKTKDYDAALNKCISRIWAVVKIVALINVLMIIALVSGPLVIWLFTGRRLFIMQFYLPFVDSDTLYGYLITIGAQLNCLFFGAFGNFAGDMCMLLFFAHVPMMASIMNLKIKELNEAADDFENSTVMKILLDVLEWHQIYTNYVAAVDAIFFWVNTVQIIMAAVSIVLSLFLMFTSDWPGSYGYVCMLFATIYLYCGMGTLAEIANDDIAAEIYGIHWYKMTTNQQKVVRLMLMKSQLPKKITVGGVIPLSVSTGLQVTKTIYSVLMMLLNG